MRKYSLLRLNDIWRANIWILLFIFAQIEHVKDDLQVNVAEAAYQTNRTVCISPHDWHIVLIGIQELGLGNRNLPKSTNRTDSIAPYVPYICLG